MTKPNVHCRVAESTGSFTVCGIEAEVGVSFCSNIEYVDCPECLKVLLYKAAPELRPYNPREDCGECTRLSITEDEQDKEWKEHRTKSPHICNKYNVQVFHKAIRSKTILRTKRCVICNGYEESDIRSKL